MTTGGPSPPAAPRGEAWGRLLVVLQFGLLAALFALAWQAGTVPPAAVLPGAAALVLGVWALRANRPGNFHVRPTPHPRGQLVRSGPYRRIRHPMYTAVLLGGVACAGCTSGIAGWILLTALAVVLLAKSSLEERWMALQHPEYRDYCRTTARFVPGLF